MEIEGVKKLELHPLVIGSFWSRQFFSCL